MGPHFAKFQATENVREEKPMLTIVWENYGKKIPIAAP